MTLPFRIDRVLASRLVLFVVIFVFFMFFDERFATKNNIFTIFEGFAFLGLGALAVAVTIIAGEFDLSIGSVAAVAGILAVTMAELGVIPSVLITVAIATVFGVVQGVLIHRLKIHSIVFTLGTLIALRGVAFIISNENSVVLQDLDLAKSVKKQLFIFSPFSLITIGVFAAVGAFLLYSRYGREIHAIGGGREEAVAAGVPLLRPIVISFALSAAMAGLAGALTSLKSGSAGPNGFENLLLPAVTAALIGGVSLFGGKGTALGVAIGALTIRFVVSGLSLGGSPFYVLTLAIGILLVVVIALELLVDRTDLRDRFREWRAQRAYRVAA